MHFMGKNHRLGNFFLVPFSKVVVDLYIFLFQQVVELLHHEI